MEDLVYPLVGLLLGYAVGRLLLKANELRRQKKEHRTFLNMERDLKRKIRKLRQEMDNGHTPT